MHLPPKQSGLHPSGQWIDFFEEGHRYVIRDRPEQNFLSATTWLSEFFPKFDREAASSRQAAKTGLPKEEILKAWDEKALNSRNKGTLLHSRAEFLIRHFITHATLLPEADLPLLESALLPPEELAHGRTLATSLYQALERMSAAVDFLEVEKVVASPRYGLAGMIDLTVRLRTQGPHPVVGLYDWKTNSRIETTNPWRQGLPPVEHLPDCNFSHYALQLNLYEFLLRNEGYFPPETRFQKVLIHLHSSGYTTHKCPDYQKEIGGMLQSRPPFTSGQ
jgi:hypothetical protein